ncbi:MAG: PQQ-binding-like beta-propeller repeat protein [bacterium]|nr:PQQ-binding-like beta-propeller repeat protein [bacterium]
MVAGSSLFILAVCSIVSQPGEMLHAFDSIEGISPTFVDRNAPSPRVLEVADGTVRFGGYAPTKDGSKYFGIKMPLGGPHDLRGKTVTFQARSPEEALTTAFYVRFYNQGESKPAWSFMSWSRPLGPEWHRFKLQHRLSLDGVRWEAGVVEDRVADRIDRVEFIIGTRDNEVDVLAELGALRIAPAEPGIADLTKPKALVRDTPVVVDGKPVAVILHPDSPEGAQAAGSVVEAVRAKTGVTIPARPATEADRHPDKTTFIIGNVFSNPAMLLLYARYMTPVDEVCPGTGGALVHTVFDPFGKGANAIVVGASDTEGLTKAVDLLSAAIDAQSDAATLTLPRIHERSYAEDFLAKYGWADDEPAPDRLEKGLAEGRRAINEGAHTSVAGVLRNVAQRYLLTGHSVEARLYAALWEMYAESAVADPRKFGGPWGFDSDFPSGKVVAGWRIIEHDPTLTDEERLATTKYLGRWLHETVIPSCVGAVGSDHVPHNHQTFPTLGTLFAGLYFTEGMSSVEGDVWLSIADRIFQRQARYFKPYEDCNGYQWLTTGHLMIYTVARPDFTIYENGNARKMMDYCLGTMDNLGYQAPYGDTGSWMCWDSETVCLDTFAFATGDPAAAWAASLKHANKKTLAPNVFQLRGGEASPPDAYNGVIAWPLEPQYHLTHGSDDRVPLERCFDKVSFREAMTPDAAYLLLDGLSNGGHKHYDGNSVPRFTQFNRVWLADNDYYKSAVKYHNSMMVFKDGQSASVPPYTELMSTGDTDRYGFSRTRMPAYAGVDWERAIVWSKPLAAFVVLDHVTALEANEYQFRLLWHGVGDANLRDEGMLLRQKGPSMWLQVAPGPDLRLNNDPDLGGNWKNYPHADPVVRSLSAIATVQLDAGQSYLFATALHGKKDGDAVPWTIQHTETGDGVRIEAADDTICIMLEDAGVTVLEGSAARVSVRPPVSNAAAGASASPHAQAWRTELKTPDGDACHVKRLTAANLAGADGPRTLLAATREGILFAIDNEGRAETIASFEASLNDVTAADFDGDGIDEVVLARHDHHVTVIDAAGNERWSRKLEYYRKPPYVNVVRTGDLDGDGMPEVIAGAENWRFYAFKADGTELWNFESVHPSRSGAVADLDGDGKAEVCCGTHYHYMSVLNPDGTRRWKHSFGPICYDITTGSFDGDNTRGVICGGGDGNVHYLGHDGKLRLRYNTGDDVRKVLAADLNGDGLDEILAGSLSHSVYCFDSKGARLWRTDLGGPVLALACSPGGPVHAGTSDGRVTSLDAAGKILASTTLAESVVDMLVSNDVLHVATANGIVTGLDTSLIR